MAKFLLLLAIWSIALVSNYYVTAIRPWNVTATCFSHRTGNHHSNDLYDGGLYYSELSTNHAQNCGSGPGKNRPNGRALGRLPHGYMLQITCNGSTIYATKADIGCGGPGRKIDIHLNAAKELGFSECGGRGGFGVRTCTIQSVNEV
jgi:hypothetical protein